MTTRRLSYLLGSLVLILVIGLWFWMVVLQHASDI
jgi:hypothetical protein